MFSNGNSFNGISTYANGDSIGLGGGMSYEAVDGQDCRGGLYRRLLTVTYFRL